MEESIKLIVVVIIAIVLIIALILIIMQFMGIDTGVAPSFIQNLVDAVKGWG